MSSFKYPPTAANGKLVLSDNGTKEAIIQAIQTRYGERVLRNRYGSDLDEFLVVSDLTAVLLDLEQAIIDSTQEYLPISLGISVEISDDGTISVYIEFDDDERTQTISLKL